MLPTRTRLNTVSSKIKNLALPAGSEFTLNEILGQDMRDSEFLEQMFWLEQLCQWIFRHDKKTYEARFRFLFQALEKNPEWAKHFRQIFRTLLQGQQLLNLFADTGHAVEHGLWGDIVNRIAKRLLALRANPNFHEIILNVVNTVERIEGLRGLSDETLQQIKNLVYDNESATLWEKVALDRHDALNYLAVHVAHYGISSEIRKRLKISQKISENSFFILGQHYQISKQANLALIEACERDINLIYDQLETTGVSVDVVNRLETTESLLTQMRNLLKLEALGEESENLQEMRDFLVTVAVAGVRGRSVFDHVRRHFYLLSRKIAERNGHSADHYTARSKSEKWKLFRSAVGGGIIVVFMTMFKTWVIRSDPPPLILAISQWIIYSSGFLIMQFFDFSLATKLPSYMASRLAGLLKGEKTAGVFKRELAVAFSSQGLALLGNIVGVIPLALLADALLKSLTGHSMVMDQHYAEHTIHELHPLYSFAIPLAMLTGIELWLSSLAGGWFENWVVFNQIPHGLAQHAKIRNFFGAKTAKRISDLLLKHSSGVAANIALGFLFGFVPLLGILFGVNWNGNHVTISTASAFFASSSLRFTMSAPDWTATIVGLMLIGVANFLVSFGLALFVAASAQRVRYLQVIHRLREEVLVHKK